MKLTREQFSFIQAGLERLMNDYASRAASVGMLFGPSLSLEHYRHQKTAVQKLIRNLQAIPGIFPIKITATLKATQASREEGEYPPEEAAQTYHDLCQARQHIDFLSNLVELYREENSQLRQELETRRSSCGGQTSEPHTPAHEAASADQDLTPPATGLASADAATPEPDQPRAADPDREYRPSAPALSADAPAPPASSTTAPGHPGQVHQSKAATSCAQHGATDA